MEHYAPLHLSALNQYADVDEVTVDHILQKERESFHKKIVVLDDDPTGTQTVHGVYVYTDWEPSTLQQAFKAEEPMFFILTNSRSFSVEYTKAVHAEIALRIAQAAKETNQEFIILSRGDSTLRGHYPLETQRMKDTLEEVTGSTIHGEIICPFFPEGGRFTMNDVHYVKEGLWLTPAGDTEFSKDKSFPYTSSHLGAYVEEKSNGAYLQTDCITISLESLRSLDLDSITKQLLNAANFAKIIVNAVDYIDLKIFCIAWLRAMKAGKQYLARCAAALPKILGNISDKPLLTKEDFASENVSHGGIIIIGSHVKKTTEQLDALMHASTPVTFLEFDVNSYFTEHGLEEEVKRILTEAEALIRSNQTVAVYTSRTLMMPPSEDKDKILEASVHISASLTQIVAGLHLKPRFIIAKGGITSSDVATKGLGIQKALVIGQIKKGIPVWLSGEESKFPHTPYIIFPGNVGEVNTLSEIVFELV